MAEWLIERGIGEHRALLLDQGEVRAARLYWPGEVFAGQQCEARLATKRAGTSRGTALLENGQEVLVDQLPRELTEGETIHLRLTRAPLAERGRFKRAQGRYLSAPAPAPADPLPEGKEVRRFPPGLWEEVWEAASTGAITFPAGQVIAFATPAMTLIDVDGPDLTNRTARDAVAAVARAIRWFDLGGSIGVDFPTVRTKADRKAIDALLEEALGDWPHERTAMNGFGFVQLVARLEGLSLLHRLAYSRVGAAARLALRRAEQVEGAGITLLTVHPALKARLRPEWLAELERRTGRGTRVETDPSLAIEAAQAQLVAHD